MPDADPHARDELLDEGFQFREVGDPVVDKKHLPAASHLKVYRLGNDLVVEEMYLRVNRVTVWRRCRDDRQVACTHQGELQRSRYRGRRHGESIDARLHLAELFFYAYAEFLFFINYEQAEVFELDRLAYDLVSADEYVDITVGQSLEDALDL